LNLVTGDTEPSYNTSQYKEICAPEVQQPRCVGQITKLYSRRSKSKHNYIIIYVYIADGGNS
jgi:hypothetical protein